MRQLRGTYENQVRDAEIALTHYLGAMGAGRHREHLQESVMKVGRMTVPVIRCSGCGAPAISPRYVCRGCGGTGFAQDSLGAQTTVYSYTVVRVAPEAFRAA